MNTLAQGPSAFDLWEENENVTVLFFERDVRNLFKKSELVITNCPLSTIEFISKETKYGNNSPLHVDFPNFTTSFKSYLGLAGMTVEWRGSKF